LSFLFDLSGETLPLPVRSRNKKSSQQGFRHAIHQRRKLLLNKESADVLLFAALLNWPGGNHPYFGFETTLLFKRAFLELWSGSGTL